MVDSFKTGEVPKPTDLTRKIEVIGAGLGRTGTMSFSAALEKLLNGPVYHSGNMLISDEECIAAPPLQALSKLKFLPSNSENLVSDPRPSRRATGRVFLPAIHASRLHRSDRYLGRGIHA
jgi:hypothetical protein